MWTLVIITLLNGDVIAKSYDQYTTMEKCFYAREMILLDMGSVNGIPPKGKQLVCIRE